MGALAKIRQAGFQAGLQEDGLAISPASLLTAEWRGFLKVHKTEIIQDLEQEKACNDSHALEFLPADDDRHHCHECQHLNYLGHCKANPTRYSPVDTHPRRCADYLGVKK